MPHISCDRVRYVASIRMLCMRRLGQYILPLHIRSTGFFIGTKNISKKRKMLQFDKKF